MCDELFPMCDELFAMCEEGLISLKRPIKVEHHWRPRQTVTTLQQAH